MNARPQAWLLQALNDLALARLASDNGFHAQACYFAAQAAEKALKGTLLELGQQVWGHGLGRSLRDLPPEASASLAAVGA